MGKKDTKLLDLFSLEELDNLQSMFYNLTGLSCGISDIDGVALTKHISFNPFCDKYIKASPKGLKMCEKCDREGTQKAFETGKIQVYKCHAGLYDFAIPIVIHGKLFGAFLSGQVSDHFLPREKIEKLAEECDLDDVELLEASRKVRIMTAEELMTHANMMKTILDILTNSAYTRYEILQESEETERVANMKSDFLANMSHEIRTPMNAVIGMAQMALREDLPPVARGYINQIISSGTTLLTIINDILDFSKIESGKMQLSPVEYEPIAMINDVASIILSRIGNKDVELILDVSPNVPTVLYGDNIRIKQILINLANNAVKFTESGQVLIRVVPQKYHDDMVDIEISVQDTGIGIKQDHIDRLFSSFYQVDSKRNRNIEGNGLGLAICERLAKQMNGQIGVESVYGEGSLFYVNIPQKIVDSTPVVEIGVDDGIKVLSIIENEYIRTQLDRDLDRLGIENSYLYDEEMLFDYENDESLYVFIEENKFGDRIREYFETNPNVTGILLVDYDTMVQVDLDNVLIVKKPIYILNIAAILRDEDYQSHIANVEVADFDFIAPKAKVLIVDDNAINLTVSEGLLKPLRMKIDTALSGKEAIEKITVDKYDMIFMDHMMPELDGVETTHIIRRFHRDYKDVPIVALTANAVDGMREKFLAEGFNEFVPKPIEMKVISKVIKNSLPPEKIERASKSDLPPSMEIMQKNMAEQGLDIHGLNVGAAMKLLGNTDLLKAVIKDYYNAIEKKSEIIKKYETEEDWKNYTIEVHALKSASRQIGAEELADMAADLEKAGNNEDAATIHDLTPAMLDLYLSYIDKLKDYCEEKVVGEKKTPTKDFLMDCFLVMRSAIENLDPDQMDSVIEEMAGYKYPEEQEDMFEYLKDAVNSLDMETCEQVIISWEEMLKSSE
ncbi:PocR ligand-binding domain-containing protein [Eubacterium xylanophilum]|uniref:PocR ligand-binding domain-containing protein n=1 Tax=Eubacterium xylanophilum TaxID=39497 RepID=UPI00047D089D|nr:PocR ligand-binding domain-containing protein [Eubacterium xylanophilum]